MDPREGAGAVWGEQKEWGAAQGLYGGSRERVVHGGTAEMQRAARGGAELHGGLCGAL